MYIYKGAVRAILMNKKLLFYAKTDVLAKDLSWQSGDTAKYYMITDRTLFLRDVKGGAFGMLKAWPLV